jgi:ABC-type glycerol-3-phosphate transport system substrate-binding protein
MKKILIIVLFLFVCSSLFAKKLEISFWHSLGFHIKEIIDDMVEEYNHTHPEVKVEPVFQGLYEELQVKMMTSAVTRQLPDIAQVQFEYFNSFVENGLVDPIDKVIPEYEKEDIPDVMWELGTRGGKIYGVPFCVSTTVLFYNENVFIKSGLDPDIPPSTWEDIIQFGKKLTQDADGDGEIDRYAMTFWADGFYGLAPFLWANGGRFFTNDGRRIILTSDEMINTIMLLRDLVFKHRIMPQKWTDWEAGQAFLTGDLAMGFFTSAAISYGEQNLPWKLRIAPMPSVNGKRYTLLAGSGLINFAKKGKKRRAAQDFIFWLVNKENTIRIHESIGYIPVRHSALNSLALKAFLKENPNYKVVIDGLNYARPLPIHTEYYKINVMLRDMLERIFLLEADPVDELSKTEIEINKLID